jgi:hypothetical protein
MSKISKLKLRGDSRYRGSYRLLIERDYQDISATISNYRTEDEAARYGEKMLAEDMHITAVIVLECKPIARLERSKNANDSERPSGGSAATNGRPAQAGTPAPDSGDARE